MSKRPISILMVCLGNICRSPLAEGLMRHHCERHGLAWTVDSAGTSGYHVGGSPDPRSIDVASARGLDISSQRARQIDSSDLLSYNYVITMDTSNYNDVKALARSQDQIDKISMLLNYSHPGLNMSVPDPYYVGSFDDVYDMIEAAVLAFINKHK